MAELATGVLSAEGSCSLDIDQYRYLFHGMERRFESELYRTDLVAAGIVPDDRRLLRHHFHESHDE
jgi:hypothetical protein